MDPDFIKSLPIVPHDMTSNQIHVHGRMSDPSNRQLLLDVAREYKDRDWLAIYTRAVSYVNPKPPSSTMLMPARPSSSARKTST
jgi:hypothetical protein